MEKAHTLVNVSVNTIIIWLLLSSLTLKYFAHLLRNAQKKQVKKQN